MKLSGQNYIVRLYDFSILFRTNYIDLLNEIAYNITVSKMKGALIMFVTATEFKTNFGKYLDMLPLEDIFITKNGKTVAKLVNPHVSAVDSISGILAGKVSDDLDRKSLRGDRMERYAIDD